MAPGESPEEFNLLCESIIRKRGCSPDTVWVMNDFVRVDGDTVVPFTTDHLINNFKEFVKKGDSLFPSAKHLRFIGDATHNQTSQGLKKMVLGVAGTHCVNGKWQNTVLPIMYVACSQESKAVLDIAMAALVALVKTHLVFNLVDKVAEWFWDGAPEAMAILPEYFPGVPGHMCLQHAKTQQGRRFTVGFKHWAVRNLEMMAFMPGPLFHLSIEALLVGLGLAG